MPLPTERRLSRNSPVTLGCWYVVVMRDGSEHQLMSPADGTVGNTLIPYAEENGLGALAAYTCDTLARRYQS